MDELDNKLQTELAPAADAPREVVLRYDAPAPQPVVERYVHPDPLPGRTARAALTPIVPDAPAGSRGTPKRGKRRSHRGLKIFLAFVALLLASVAVSHLRGGETKKSRDGNGFYFEYHVETQPKDDAETTTIARYPNGGDVRLRFSETHGDALAIQQVYERVNPCTVTVATLQSGTSGVVGTGVVFTEDGYILTNAHVITGGTEVAVALTDGRVFRDAKLVGYDETNDLAVLKIDARGLSVAEFGDSDALTVGDTVYAIGNPLGVELRGTLTDGIVSAINRDVKTDGVTMTLIQTNAALNEGNSGGPLINVYGQVVGINTMKMRSKSSVSVEGLGFAIPVSSAAWIVDDLIAFGETRGEPVLGILVEAGRLPTGEGAVFVREVTRDDDPGLMPGDVIRGAEGDPVETTGDLLRIRRRFRAGETMTLEIERDGERVSVDVTLRAAE